jgi:hypothetical protein
VHFSELQWLSGFVFLISLIFFSLVSISFSFLAFLAIMALRPRLVIFVENISESSKNVAFEDKVLSWYRNWNLNRESKFPYLYYDLIDRARFIIVNMKNP